MHDLSYITTTLIFLGAAVVVVPLMQLLRTGPVLGYLVAGGLIGPHAIGVIGDPDAAGELAELGVVFLLFAIGLELSLERLWALRRYILGLGTIQVVLTGALIAVLSVAAGVSVAASVVIGGGLALSSTAFVARLLQDTGEQSTRFGRIAIAILLLQDLAAVPLLTLVPLLAAAQGGVLSASGLALAKAAVAVAGVVLAGRFILRPVFRAVAAGRNPELFSAMTLLVVLGTAWALSEVGLSMALGAFLAGLLLSETEYRHQVEADIRPFRGLFLGLFFMAVGMSLDIGGLADHLPQTLAIAVALLVGKATLIALLCRAFRLETGLSIRLGLMLAQGGEFAFILFGLAISLNIIPSDMGQNLIAAVILSMLATPVLAWLGAWIDHRLARSNADMLSMLARETADLSDHVVVAGFGRIGQTVAKVLDARAVPYVAIDVDIGRVRECVRRGLRSVFFGDASNPGVLAAAGVGRARVVIIALDHVTAAARAVNLLRRYYPELHIVVRSRDRAHSLQLEEAGASKVVLESAEASLQLGAVALARFGAPEDQIASVLDDLRANDYRRLDDVVGGRKTSL